jgi:PIN domain nuclease of toxin-antitoxin system
VKLLLDTQLLLWAAGQSERLPLAARRMIEDTGNQLVFSATSIWEVAIKSGLGRSDFRADARLLRRGLLANGYEELPILGEHAVAVADLPPIHKDPFDRLLIAQSMVEGILLITTDPIITQYPGPTRNVGESMASRVYKLFAQAIAERKQIFCTYERLPRELCPHILGHTKDEEVALTFQFGGHSKSGLPPGGEWRCLSLSKVQNVRLRDGPWHAGSRHTRTQPCVEIVDVDVNPSSPYRPRRRL